ncbi:MAG: type II secretion system protein [Acidobacteria bacterium]|nr:MAG: type II secretion system protein [Acidobacteriota bacterium]
MNRGFSLVEALIVVAVISIVLGSIFGIAYQAQMSFDAEKRFTETSQHARIAMDEITRYIRQAGNNPNPKTFNLQAVQYHGPSSIELWTDITGSHDGVTGDPDRSTNSPLEHVMISYLPGAGNNRGTVTIRDYAVALGTDDQILAENVDLPDGTPFFQCFDTSGTATTTSNDIVSIEVTMRASTPERMGGRVNSVTYRSHVFIRSKTFDVFAVP